MASRESQHGARMGSQAVALKIAPFLRIECKFWLTDDGWNSSCEQSHIVVQAGSFEHVKSEMEIALGKYLESRLREPQRTNTGQAAPSRHGPSGPSGAQGDKVTFADPNHASFTELPNARQPLFELLLTTQNS